MRLKPFVICCVLALVAPVVGTFAGEIALAAEPACGRPASSGEVPAASDALHVLLAALGLESCAACVCDVDDSVAVTATDALMVLRSAVGYSIELACPACGDSVVRFIAVGDTGKDNSGQYAVADAIAAKCAESGCDFVQLLGDNIYESGVTSTSDPQWQTKFETPYADVNAPFYVVLGNHDYGGDGVGDEFGKAQHEIDYTKVSTKWRLPAAYYHRKASNVEFFALDTNLQIYHMDAKQRTDVAAWLAASTATWQIVFGHHPYRSNGPHGNAGSFTGAGGNGAGVKSFIENVVCGNADVYFSGHDHTLQWLTPTCDGTELIVSGTGAAATSLSGSNETRFESLALGFVYVVIDGKTLTASMIDENGNTLFTRTLTKP